MQTLTRSRRTLGAIALLTATLAACDGGEDLDALHTQALDDAAFADRPESGAANPATTAIDPDEYALVFQDEFQGLTLDEAQ